VGSGEDSNSWRWVLAVVKSVRMFESGSMANEDCMRMSGEDVILYQTVEEKCQSSKKRGDGSLPQGEANKQFLLLPILLPPTCELLDLD